MQDSLVASRTFEAKFAALSCKFENEKMRQADMEAQAWHANSRRNDIVQAYHPMLKRIHVAERMQHEARLRADAIMQQMASLTRTYESTLETVEDLKQENRRLHGIERQHPLLLEQNLRLKAELQDVSTLLYLS